ncbi:serine--tRNA ligase [Candidatus Parcubacteria bacterium]|nr:serine--tRNA ligase [Candidatus Parcubacteria bacterium]
MLDIKYIRENKEAVIKGCQKKQVKIDIDRLFELDEKRRELMTSLDSFSAEKNKAGKEIVDAGEEKEKQKIIAAMKEVDEKSDKLQQEFKIIDQEFSSLLFKVPNMPLDEVPEGKDDKENISIREVGKKPNFDFEPKDYLTIAENLDMIDVKRAAKVSGARFGYLKGDIALLEFALINFIFNTLTKEGFVPVVPPVMIKKENMKDMGYFEREDSDEVYQLEKDGLVLVGTSEQSIGPMHRDEIFEEKDLPKRYAAFSTCFRREAGSYGKDTKGILRVHQFDKVEMFSFCNPASSKEEHQLILAMEEKLMQELEIPYQVLQICTGDLGAPAAVKYDVEAWLPTANCYRETHSTSNCTDFQARSLNMRYRNKETGKLEFIHTLNGTAFAIGRIIIAIIENYQQKDGSIKVPKALQKYLNKEVIGK